MQPHEIEAAGLIAIIRARSGEGVLDAARALVRGGIRALEITLNTPDALEIIATLRAESGDVAAVGAGTILDVQDARNAIEAGAQFIVTPTLQPDSIALCRAHQTPIVCGCLTPTEALAAHRAGADFIKIFPATTFGAGYIRDVLAPLPFLKLVPTGGVEAGNISEFFRAGCAAVAVGSHLVSGEILATKDWDGLESRARDMVKIVESANVFPSPGGRRCLSRAKAGEGKTFALSTR